MGKELETKVIFTVQYFAQPFELYRALKARQEIQLFASERGEFVPDFGLITVHGPKYAAKWQVVVEVQMGRITRFIGSPKPLKSVKVKHYKASPAADLAWGWPHLHEQKMTVRPDAHTSELKRDMSKHESAVLERIGREDY